jgi:hypothetical protein
MPCYVAMSLWLKLRVWMSRFGKLEVLLLVYDWFNSLLCVLFHFYVVGVWIMADLFEPPAIDIP